MCFSKYKHTLWNWTLFSLLENVGKIGQDLSAGPDSKRRPRSRVYLGLCPFHFHTSNDVPDGQQSSVFLRLSA